MRAALICLAAMAAVGAEPISSLRFSDSTLVIAGGDSVRIARAPSWSPESPLKGRLAQVLDVAMSPDAKLLAVAGGSAAITGAVEIYDAPTRGLLRTVARAGDLIYGVAFSPDGKLLAAASADHYAYLVDVASGKTIARLAGHVGPVLCVAFSPDGATLATGSADRSLRLWQAADGKLLRSLQNHGGSVNGALFSPDSQTLYSAAEDSTVRVWVVANGRMKHIYRGLEAPVMALAGALSRNRLVVTGADGGLRILDAENGSVLSKSAGGAGAWRHAVAVSPDAKWIASADAAGNLRVMEFPQ